MGLYGPFTAAAGVVQQCAIDGQAQGLYIRNASIYDLAIAFVSYKPTASSSFAGEPWYTVIPAGDRVGVRIPAAIYGGMGFPGYVWVLPIDNTGSLALTGTSSANKNFWMETYVDAERLPPDYASAQFQNLASQPRVITIPAVSPALYAISRALTVASAGNYVDTGFILWSTGLAPLPSTYVVYLYVAAVSLNPSAATVVGEFSMVVRQVQAGVEKANTIIWRQFIGLSAAVSTRDFMPAAPHSLSQNPFSGAIDSIQLALFCHSFPAGTATIDWTVAAMMDFTTNQQIPAIGQTQLAAVKGIVY